MFNINDSHQSFKNYDDNNILKSAWTMDKIKRNDHVIWIMNHFFVNPDYDFAQELDHEMQIALSISKKSDFPIWPLDPIAIKYFEKHPEFHDYWYHKPFND